MEQKNVLWIMTDQQRVNAMGCADSSYITPNIDELANKGIRFTGTVTTSAQCTPARASWETGKYPHQVGVNQIGHAINPNYPLVAKEFKKSGYQTVHFGKWHLFTDRKQCGYEILDYRVDGVLHGPANMKNPDSWSAKDALSTAMAINYIQDSKKDPFFMVLSWYCPHPGTSRFELIEEFAHLYPLNQIPIPSSFYDDDLTGKPKFQRLRADSEESMLTEEQIRIDGQKYRTMISYLDWNVGRIMKVLEDKGILENTIIIFTSDHGDMQGAHRLALKGVLPYRELFNVPLIIYEPGRQITRKIIDDLVSSAAVPGTILDLAGLPVPDSFEGGSLLEHLEFNKTPEEQYVFFEHYKAYWGFHPFYGIQTDKWKYVFYYQENMEEMYDLVNDPNEIRNIAEFKEVQSTKLSLKKIADSWWEKTGALNIEPIIANNVKGVWNSLI
ncbi:sulfatase-like hydrolase/transferase [Fodinisporobacter ferrooxydans]|uniref:Sulfatase-like hydrolase/transferase n=1 Tax=Fodinisporobacter ferrooxydans TaxID=2901836 RepID=A0ABY4CHL2_9BACL|nr:sulfatase-like hydrolase/transferase [Alicyclobacillaceae bacterium MYW30-H2]